MDSVAEIYQVIDEMDEAFELEDDLLNEKWEAFWEGWQSYRPAQMGAPVTS